MLDRQVIAGLVDECQSRGRFGEQVLAVMEFHHPTASGDIETTTGAIAIHDESPLATGGRPHHVRHELR
jgi:hypothetical protein